jgi:hypothetical protein
MADSRFSRFATDPKFRTVPRKEKKVSIDGRFKSMFKDDRFVSKTGVDKRGRPAGFSSKENFRRYYNLGVDSDEDTSESSDGEGGGPFHGFKNKSSREEDEEDGGGRCSGRKRQVQNQEQAARSDGGLRQGRGRLGLFQQQLGGGGRGGGFLRRGAGRGRKGRGDLTIWLSILRTFLN